jgi:hypothetical protein
VSRAAAGPVLSAGEGESSFALGALGRRNELDEPSSGTRACSTSGASTWMGQHQSALIQSFPGIISGIEKVFFKDFDFHVMVMDADHSHWGSYDCKDDTSCPGDFGVRRDQ